MFQFFDSVAGIFGTVVDYIVSLFQILLSLVLLIFKAQRFLLDIITSLPPFLLVFAVVFISLAILFQILNKGA